MKRLILSLCIASGLTCAATSLPADSLASAPEVARFYEGCMKIAEAETATDPSVANSAYAKAMDLLNTRSTYSRKGIVLGLMKAEIIDDSGMATERPADFAYDYAYARARYKSIDFTPKGMSRGLGKGCRVLDLAIKPGGKVVCRDNVKGNCILVAMARPGDKVDLEVTAPDGRSICGAAYDDGMVGYARWQNGDTAPALYTITNPTDRVVQVTIFAN